MTRIVGGTQVESGYYVNTRSLAVVNLPAAGALPGTEKEHFVAVPWPLLLVAAPLVGGLFVVTYPVFGFSMMAWGLARKLVGAAGHEARELAATLAPGQAVGEAHLTGKPGEGAQAEGKEIDALEREIREKREGK